MHNNSLKIPIPKQARVVDFAGDIALVVVAKHMEDVAFYSFEAISPVDV